MTRNSQKYSQMFHPNNEESPTRINITPPITGPMILPHGNTDSSFSSATNITSFICSVWLFILLFHRFPGQGINYYQVSQGPDYYDGNFTARGSQECCQVGDGEKSKAYGYEYCQGDFLCLVNPYTKDQYYHCKN